MRGTPLPNAAQERAQAASFAARPVPVPKDTDENLTANSDALVPTQKAVKAYVDNAIGVASAAIAWANTTLGLTAISANPTKGTIVTDKVYWRRIGDSMEIRVDYEQSTAGTAGTGNYLLAIPDSKTIDTTKCRVHTGAAGGKAYLGSGVVSDLTSYKTFCVVLPYDTTHVRLDDFSTGFIGSTYRPISASTYAISAWFTVPIAEWA